MQATQAMDRLTLLSWELERMKTAMEYAETKINDTTLSPGIRRTYRQSMIDLRRRIARIEREIQGRDSD
jgi:hypothetical protein